MAQQASGTDPVTSGGVGTLSNGGGTLYRPAGTNGPPVYAPNFGPDGTWTNINNTGQPVTNQNPNGGLSGPLPPGGLSPRPGVGMVPGNNLAPNKTAGASNPNDISKQMQAFFDELNKPLDLNDPYVHQVIQGASNAASQDARNRGIGGPLSVANTQDMTTKAELGLSSQRSALAASVLGSMSGRDVSLQDLAEKRNEFNTGMQNAYSLANYQNAQNAAGGIGAGIGGAIGGIGGFIVGGPAGAAAGAQAGSSIGGGIGRGASGNTLPTPSLIPGTGGGY